MRHQVDKSQTHKKYISLNIPEHMPKKSNPEIWYKFKDLLAEVKTEFKLGPEDFPVGIRNVKAQTKVITKERQLRELQKYYKKLKASRALKKYVTRRRLQKRIELRNERKVYEAIRQEKFNEVVDRVLEGKTLSPAMINEFWNKLQRDRYNMVITKTNGQVVTIPLNTNTQQYFIDLMSYGTDYERDDQYGSDVLDSYSFNEIVSIEIKKYVKPKKEYKDKTGGFFIYTNTTGIDLSKYQIYTEEQISNTKTSLEQCLLNALKDDVDPHDINRVKLAFVTNGLNTYIKRKDIQKVADIIGRDIMVFYYDNKNENRIRTKIYKTNVPNVSENQQRLEPVKVAMYKDHYFKYEDTKYSSYAITNYEELKDQPDFHDIYQKNRRSSTKWKLSSLKLIHTLFKQGYFIKTDQSKFPEATVHPETRDDIYLDDIQNEQRLFDPSKVLKKIRKETKTKKKETKIYYADCESFVYNPRSIHELYLLGYVSSDNDIVSIRVTQEQLPEKVVTRWMHDMTSGGKNNAICYYHNLKYDYHLLEKYLPLMSKVVKDNSIYSVTLKYKGRTIELRDSFKLIPFALAEFAENFKLPEKYKKKEAIAYTYYTPDNHDDRINTSVYRELLSNEEKEIFDRNVVKCISYYQNVNLNGEIEETFNPLTYYKDYLKLDCLVLKYGMKKFNEIILGITDKKLSIYDKLTISSLTDAYMIINGAYDGVYEVKGNLREYISKAVYGGRVCVNEKYKKKVIEGKISDYDGVSLYPSSINRLCREVGLPKGKAKRFSDQQISYANSQSVSGEKVWKDTTYAVMTVRITKVNKTQQIPFIAYKDSKQGSTQYLNTPPPEDLIIDKFTLEDYIKFHHIEYQILDGVYWNSGGNNTMGKLIQKLFNERLKHKKENPALANTLKLMLNSAYGKTILKKSNSKIEIVKDYKDSKFDDYIYNNFHTIKKHRRINAHYHEFESTCCDDSYNRAHVGASILSYSKRIMNEVFDIANTNMYPIYYTDTDSIHMNFEHVQPLETKYRETYGKVLNGKNLEQFHTDFNLKGACSEIYSVKAIFLGKKSYIDILESTDAEGKKITGHHIKLKGITEEGLEHTAKKYSADGKTPEYFKLYEDLARGTEIEITLNPYNVEKNKTKVLFEFKDGSVSTKQKFIRKVRF